MTKLDLNAVLRAYRAAKEPGMRPLVPLLKDAIETIPGLITVVAESEREIQRLRAEVDALRRDNARLGRWVEI